MKFLVIDDHELIREAVRGALQQLDAEAEILEAADGAQAMTIVAVNEDLDLILLDLNLPDRDGFSMLLELRRNHPAISVVVMSAQQDQDSVMRSLNMGALGFIPKTVRRKVILGALQLVMSGGVYIPQQALSTGTASAGASNQSSTPAAPAAQARPAEATPAAASVSPSDLGLTGRQVDVLMLLMRGMPNKAICRALDLAEPTVKTHVSAILRALNVSNRAEVVVAVNAMKLDLPPAPGA
jgi:DNA-binding NarL/FixJ family response regulator